MMNYNVVFQYRNLLIVFASFLLSVVLVWMPWEFIKPSAFLDLDVYRNKFTFETSVLIEKEINTLWGFFINEGLWDVSIRYLSSVIGISLESIFSFIAFFTIFIFCKYIAVRHGVIAIVFVLNPLVIDFAFSQIRMALAISIFVIGVDVNKKYIKCFLFILSCFVHTVLVLFIGVYLLCSSYFKSNKIRALFLNSPVLFVFFVALSIFFVIGPMRVLILNYLGDRRGVYPAGGSTLLYASFWFVYAFVLVFISVSKKFVNIDIMMSFIWVLVFLFATFFGMYGARFLSASYPFIVSSMLALISMEFKNVIYRRSVDGRLTVNVDNLMGVNVLLSASLLGVFAVYSLIQWRYWFI
ncbi:MAG: hypothetical protein QM503_00340 [Bacteroidota bacterium]